MFGISRIVATLVAALVLILGVLGLYAWGREGHQKALQAANATKVVATQRDELRASLEAANRAALRGQEIALARVAAADALHKLDQARLRKLNDEIASHPEWATAPVPDGVWDALFPSEHPADAARPAPAPATGGLPDPGRAEPEDQRGPSPLGQRDTSITGLL